MTDLEYVLNFINGEYNSNLTVNDISDSMIPVAYTELGDNNEYPVQTYYDISKHKLIYTMDDKTIYEESCEPYEFEDLTFDYLIRPYYYELEEDK